MCVFALCVYLVLCPGYLPDPHSSLFGRVVVIDAGHGFGTGGSYGSYDEGERMLFLAKLIQEELESRGATVLMTRQTHADVYLAKRPVKMNLWSLEALSQYRKQKLRLEARSGITCSLDFKRSVKELAEISHLIGLLERVLYNICDYAPIYMNYPFDHYHQTVIHPAWRRVFRYQSDPLFRYNWLVISLHSNAKGSGNTASNGAVVFFSSNYDRRNPVYFNEYSHVEITRLFGGMLLDAIAEIGIRRYSLSPAAFMVIRENNLPSVLVENGFHTNPGDRALLQCDVFMWRLAMVYANTIEAYFELLNSKGG